MGPQPAAAAPEAEDEAAAGGAARSGCRWLLSSRRRSPTSDPTSTTRGRRPRRRRNINGKQTSASVVSRIIGPPTSVNARGYHAGVFVSWLVRVCGCVVRATELIFVFFAYCAVRVRANQMRRGVAGVRAPPREVGQRSGQVPPCSRGSRSRSSPQAPKEFEASVDFGGVGYSTAFSFESDDLASRVLGTFAIADEPNLRGYGSLRHKKAGPLASLNSPPCDTACSRRCTRALLKRVAV